MTTYLTEEEQIENIKKWWGQYGNYIVGLVLALTLAIVGVRWWQQRALTTRANASAVFQQLVKQVAEKDNDGLFASAALLKTSFPKSTYAQFAALFQARAYVYQDELAEADKALAWIIENGNQPALIQTAKIRRARLLLSQKQFGQARAELAVVADAAYQPAVEELQGDIDSAEGKHQAASAHYRLAQTAYTERGMVNPLLQLKLNSLSNANPIIVREPQSALPALSELS